jgi:hypothetical protein
MLALLILKSIREIFSAPTHSKVMSGGVQLATGGEQLATSGPI